MAEPSSGPQKHIHPHHAPLPPQYQPSTSTTNTNDDDAPLTITTPLPMPNTPATMPILGFGTWDSPAAKTRASVLAALEAGYRHIDTAQYYGNETEVGAAITASGIPRSEVFVTTKILTARGSTQKCYESCLESVERIDPSGSGYVDQFLIHNILGSRQQRKEVWGALERLFDEGKARSIGVSNWGVVHIEEMRGYASVWPPQCDQVELHPWCQQTPLTSYLHKHNIAISAYSPLVRNREAHNPPLVDIAKTHGKTTAQVLIRYCMQKGWAPLPKSDTPARIVENAEVFDFDLSGEEMEVLDGIREGGEDEPVVQVAINE